MTSAKLLRPPPGYTSWLDFAVDCMDTRSLEQQELWIDAPAERHWPEGTTREQMQQAAMAELAELRALAFANQLEAPSQILEKCETVPQAEIDAWAEKVSGDAPPLEGFRVDEQASAYLRPFKNRSAIEKARYCVCYHCLSGFQSEQIANWTDDGETALCPICGIDAVLAQIADQPILLEWLIDYWKEEFSTDGLPQEHEVAKVRLRLEQIGNLKGLLANDLPEFLSTNYPLFVETMLRHGEETTVTDIAVWLLYGQAERLNLLLSGKEREIFKQLFEAEAGVYV